MKKLLILSFVLFSISGKSFAYYSYEQIKYEQSIGSHETLDRVMENPKQAEKMYYQHMNEKNNYNRDSYNYSRPTYTEEKPLYKFGNSSEL